MSCPECGVLNCPDCGGVLVLMEEKLAGGRKIKIQYCFACGGYWCDHWAANDLDYEQFLELSGKLPIFDKKNVFGGDGRCPHCFAALQVLSAESVPLNLSVKYCPQCRGNWFPQGEFKKFKFAQKTKLDYFKTWNIPLASIYQVLLPVLVLAIIGISIPYSVNLVKRNSENRTLASDYIKKVNVISVNHKDAVISFFTTEPAAAEIEYGQNLFLNTKRTISVDPQTFHKITLEGLIIGDKYYYRIILHKDGKAVTLPESSFVFE